MQPQQSRRLVISPEDEARIAKAKATRQGVKVDGEWLFIAEFGYYFGWDGIRAIRNNEITLEEANVLLQGAIKVWYGKLVQQSELNYIANRASGIKKGNKVMSDALRDLKRLMKADV